LCLFKRDWLLILLEDLDMYSVILMMALSGGAEAPTFGHGGGCCGGGGGLFGGHNSGNCTGSSCTGSSCTGYSTVVVESSGCCGGSSCCGGGHGFLGGLFKKNKHGHGGCTGSTVSDCGCSAAPVGCDTCGSSMVTSSGTTSGTTTAPAHDEKMPPATTPPPQPVDPPTATTPPTKADGQVRIITPVPTRNTVIVPASRVVSTPVPAVTTRRVLFAR